MGHPLFDAVQPVLDAIDAELVTDPEQLIDGDIPLAWMGRVLGGVRLRAASIDLTAHLSYVERLLGAPLADLGREDKQRAVKLLEDCGAFRLRKSVEEVAGVLGVSRFTVYNYLNRPAP